MHLTIEQIKSYQVNGFLFVPDYFTTSVVDEIKMELNKIQEIDSPAKILEKNGKVRSIFGAEKTSALLRDLSRSQYLVGPSKQLLDSDVYIHQSKFNFKVAFDGDWWDWHQDFVYWHEEDHIPFPNMLTAMVFLDDVNEFNGPLFIIPGSQQYGIVEHDRFRLSKIKGQKPEENYMAHVSSDLKYTLDRDQIAQSIKQTSIESIKGKRGSVLFFHCAVFHASCNNLSPWDRCVYMVTYNDVKNAPASPELLTRPDFLANRDFSPILY